MLQLCPRWSLMKTEISKKVTLCPAYFTFSSVLKGTMGFSAFAAENPRGFWSPVSGLLLWGSKHFPVSKYALLPTWFLNTKQFIHCVETHPPNFNSKTNNFCLGETQMFYLFTCTMWPRGRWNRMTLILEIRFIFVKSEHHLHLTAMN